jgi:hypothetical protein
VGQKEITYTKDGITLTKKDTQFVNSRMNFRINATGESYDVEIMNPSLTTPKLVFYKDLAPNGDQKVAFTKVN